MHHCTIAVIKSTRVRWFLECEVYFAIKTTLTIAEKDCQRTDRHLEFYSEGNENTDKLRRILTTFVLHDPELGKQVITIQCLQLPT